MTVAVLGLAWGTWHVLTDADAPAITPSGGTAEEGEGAQPPILVGRGKAPPAKARDLGPVHGGGIQDVSTVRVPFSGSVVDPAGANAADAVMTLSREEGWVRFRTDDHGRFQVEVPAGRYDLSIHKARVGGLQVQGEELDGISGRDRAYRLDAPATFALRYQDGAKGLPGLRTTIRLLASGRPDGHVFTGSTDADGVVRLRDVIKGFYDVETQIRPGWVQRREGWNAVVGRTEGLDSPVPGGRGGVLRGVVRDLETSAPVAGAKLTLLLYSIGSGSWLESTATSNADGRYGFEPVIGQVRALYAAAAGYANWPRDHFEGREVTSKWPMHQSQPPFGSFHLIDGLDIDIDVGLRRGRGVEGTVRDADGKPVSGLTLRFGPVVGDRHEPPDEHHVQTGADGAYSVEHLREAQYGVQVVDTGWFLQRFHSAQLNERDLAPGPVVLDVEVVRGRPLRGVVRHADGKPAFGARVWMSGPYSLLAPNRAQSRRFETFSARDGAWAFESAPPGPELTLEAALGSDKSQTLVTGEGPAENLELVLSPTGSVHGQVLCGDADTRWRAVVRLEPEGEPAQRTAYRVGVDGNGQFHIEHVAPGRWRALVLLGTRTSEQPVEIEVRPHETVEVEIELVSQLTLTGIVVDAAGTPADSMRVSLIGRYRTEKNDWKRVRRDTKTDAAGRFQFSDLLAGEYAVRVSGAPHALAGRKQLVGHEKDIRLVLETD